MGTSIRRFVGDTDLLFYAIREIPFGSERSSAVDLTDATVYFRMVDAEDRDYDIDDEYIFETEIERDAYFVSNPAEKIDGLLITVNAEYQRWNGTDWSTDYTVVVDKKECNIVDDGEDGIVSYQFTEKEVAILGIYHICFYVETGDDPVISAQYPRGEALWIHIMDINM